MKLLVVFYLTAGAILSSPPSWACPIKGEMAGDLAFWGGVLNGLKAKKYENFSILSIRKVKSEHRVLLYDKTAGLCWDVTMSAWGPGDCTFTADTKKVTPLDKKVCEKEQQ